MANRWLSEYHFPQPAPFRRPCVACHQPAGRSTAVNINIRSPLTFASIHSLLALETALSDARIPQPISPTTTHIAWPRPYRLHIPPLPCPASSEAPRRIAQLSSP